VVVLSEGVVVVVGHGVQQLMDMPPPVLNLRLLLLKTSQHRSRISPNLLLISRSQLTCTNQMAPLRLM